MWHCRAVVLMLTLCLTLTACRRNTTPIASSARPAASATPGTAAGDRAVFALLANNVLLATRLADGALITEHRLGPTLPPSTMRTPGYYLGLSGDGRRLFALVSGEGGGEAQIAVFDVPTATPIATYPLGVEIVFSSLAVGPKTGRLYLFGRPGDGRIGTVIRVLDSESGAVVREWDTGQGSEPPYKGLVTDDERELIISYHNAGAYWYGLHDGELQSCRDVTCFGRNSIRAHGNIVPYGDGFLVATGGEAIWEVDRHDQIRRTLETGIVENHPMEFAVDPRAGRLYATGPCAYPAGQGYIALDLATGSPLGPATTPTGSAAATPVLFRSAELCGERIVAGPEPLLIIGQITLTVAYAGAPGRLLFVDWRTGAILRSMPTSSEPLDVIVTTQP